MTESRCVLVKRPSLQRRAMDRLVDCVHAVPASGDVSVLLRADARAKDAALTLTAMGVLPVVVVEYINDPRFSESIFDQLVVSATISEFKAILANLLR